MNSYYKDISTIEDKHSDADIDRMLAARITKEPVQPEAPVEKRGATGTFTSSLARGIDQTQAGLYAGGALLAQGVGATGVRDKMLEGYTSNMAEAGENVAEIGSISNIHSAGDLGTWAIEAAGELAPSIATMFATGGIGGALAGTSKALGEKVATKFLTKRVTAFMSEAGGKMSAEAAKKAAVKELGQLGGAWAGSSAMEAGHMYGTDVDERGVENANAFSAALLGGVSGATDVMLGVEGKLIRGMAGKFGNKVAAKLEGKIAAEMAKGAGREFGQEALQEFLAVTNEAMNEHGAANESYGDIAMRLTDAGAKGAVGGMGFGAATHVGNKLNAPQADPTKTKQDVASLTAIDEEETLARWEAEYAAQDAARAQAEDSELRRMSGEDLSSIFQQHMANRQAGDERIRTPEGRQSIINEVFGEGAATPEGRQGVIDNQLSDKERIEAQEREMAARRTTPESRQAEIDSQYSDRERAAVEGGDEQAPNAPLGSTPITQNLGVGLSSLGTIDQVTPEQQSQNVPRESMPSDGAYEQEWQQAEQQRDQAIEQQSNAQFDAEMIARRKQQIEQSRLARGTVLEQKLNDKIKRKRAGLKDDSPLSGAEIDAVLQSAREAGIATELKDKEIAKLAEQAKVDSDGDPEWMNDWFNVLEASKKQRELELKSTPYQHNSLSNEGEMKTWADTANEAGKQVSAERETAARDKASDWSDPSAWREYRELRRKKGRALTEAEEAEFAASVEGGGQADSGVFNVKQSEAETPAPAVNVGGVSVPVSTPENAPASAPVPTSGVAQEIPTQVTAPAKAPVQTTLSLPLSQPQTPIEQVVSKVKSKRVKAADPKPAPAVTPVEAPKVEVAQPKPTTIEAKVEAKVNETIEKVVEAKVAEIVADKVEAAPVETKREPKRVKVVEAKPEPVVETNVEQKPTATEVTKAKVESKRKPKADSKSTEDTPSRTQMLRDALRNKGFAVHSSDAKAEEAKAPVAPTKKRDSLDLDYMSDESAIGNTAGGHSERQLSSDDGEYFSKVPKGDKPKSKSKQANDKMKEKMAEKSKGKDDKGKDGKEKVESKPKADPKSKPESPVKDATKDGETSKPAAPIQTEAERTKAISSSLTAQAKLVFGNDAKITTLDSGNIIAVLKNGSAILVRQNDVIWANESKGEKAYGSWLDESMVAERYGATINRGGIVTLAKYQKDSTALHESFHAAMSLALSPLERKIILKKYGNEEKAAEAYENWVPGPKPTGVFANIHSLFKVIANMFSDNTSGDDVFNKVRKGEAWKKHTTKTENKKGGAGAEARASSSDVDSSSGEQFSIPAFDEMIADNPNAAEGLRKMMGVSKDSVMMVTHRTVNDMLRGDMNSFDGYKETFFSKFREGTFDVLDRIRTLENMYNEKFGKTGNEAYWTNRLATSVDSVLSAFLQHGPVTWKNGISTVETENAGFLPLAKKLGAELHPWLVSRVVTRAEKLMAEGRENNFTEKDLVELRIMADKHRGANEELYAEADRLYESLQKSVLKFATDAGIVSQESVDIFHHPEYFPFYRIVEDQLGAEKDTVFMPGGKDIKNAIQKLKGGESKLGDPLTNMVKNWSILITQAMRNNARAKTINMAMEVSKGMSNPYIQLASKEMKGHENVLNLMVNGKNTYYLIKDKALFDAMDDSIQYADRHFMWKAANKAKRLLTLGATAVPAFRVKNFIRDTIQNIVFNKSVTFSDVFEGLHKAMTDHPDYIALRASGGAFSHGYLHGSDPKSVHSYIEELVTKDGKNVWQKTKGNLKGVWDKWQKIGDAAENANRLALYSRLIKDGKSEMEAAYEAKDLLDFSMRGGSKALNDFTYIIPFLNARIAGLYKLGRAVSKRNDDGELEVARMATLLAGASLGLLAYNMTANKDEWDKLPNHERWNYYHMWLTGEDGNKTHIRMPKPFELGAIFSSLPEVIAEGVFGKEDMKYLFDYVAFTTTQTLSVDLRPQLAKPYWEDKANKDSFTGRQIVPFGMEYLTPNLQFTENTSDTIKAFCSMVEAVDGDLMPDMLKSPVRFEHLVRGYFSSLGIMTTFTADLIGRQFNVYADKPVGRSDFSATLLKDDSIASSRQVEQFYDLAAKIESYNNTISAYKKAGDKEGLRDYLEDHIGYDKAKGEVGRARKALSQIRAQRLVLMNNRTLSNDEKYEKLQVLIEKRNAIADRVITKHRELY